MNPNEPVYQSSHDPPKTRNERQPLVVFVALLIASFACAVITLSVTPNSVGDEHRLQISGHVVLVHVCCGSVTTAIVCGLARRNITGPSISGILLLAILAFVAPAFGVLCTSAIFALDGYTSEKRASTFMTIVAFALPVSYAFSLLVAYAIRIRHDRLMAGNHAVHRRGVSAFTDG